MGKRIGYIDAVRGLAMAFVVIGHVFHFSIHHVDNIYMRILCEEIEIPLLFMVSGFLLKVPKNGYWSYIKEKAFLLCVPAAIVMHAYVWENAYSYSSAWVDSFKAGYWFTFSLFQFVVVYSMIKCIFQAMRLNHISETVLFILVCVFIRYVSVWCMREEQTYTLIPLLGLIHFRLFIYFVIGILIAEYGLLSKSLSNKDVRVGGVILAVCILLHFYTYHGGGVSFLVSGSLWMALTTLSGLFIILMGFRMYESWSESKIGHLLQMLGRYTLDIYFIHYFFLPRNLGMVGEWFKENPNSIIEYMFAMAIAAVVIIASLLVGRIIRLSPVLAHWLLAAKK